MLARTTFAFVCINDDKLVSRKREIFQPSGRLNSFGFTAKVAACANKMWLNVIANMALRKQTNLKINYSNVKRSL